MSLDIYETWSQLVKKHTVDGACNFQDAACELAHLVAAAAKAEEREACARECEEVDANPRVVLHHAIVCAAAIRSRNNA